MTEHEVDLGPKCPSCGEPWLRATNLPGRYRCVYCLHRFELRSDCPGCGAHSTIARMSDTANVACRNCGSLDVTADLSEPPGGAAAKHGPAWSRDCAMNPPVGTGVDSATAEEAMLMAQIAAGDSGEPMVALYQRYGSTLYGLGLRLLGDRGMAEEMVQETFVRLWRAAGRFDRDKASVRTFTYMIARRVAVDLRRRPASRPLDSQEEIDDEIDSSRALREPCVVARSEHA